ncbi:hypothetical protein FOCC_FOCC015213 [Frankliniella occidentalis]|nr:hypothetical protein FOCC_FOCC015213 [Frankliniella occidentalis]
MDFLKDPCFDRENIESQWRKLGQYSLDDLCPAETSVLEVAVDKFWTAVYNMRTGGGQRAFADLARYVLACLCLPLSNAAVERLFSILTVVKNKLRNKMGMEMVEAILRVRFHLQAKGICCTQFEPTEEMLRLFNAKNMYGPRRDRDRSAAAAAFMDLDEGSVDDPEAMGEPAEGEPTDAETAAAWEDALNLVNEGDEHQPFCL